VRMGGFARWKEEAWRSSLARMAAASCDVCSRTFAVRTRQQPHSGDLRMALIYGGIDPARQMREALSLWMISTCLALRVSRMGNCQMTIVLSFRKELRDIRWRR
jgi:hypothetical protein